MIKETFTDRALTVLHLAEESAHQLNQAEVCCEQVLLGIAQASRGIARLVLESCGVDLSNHMNGIPLPARTAKWVSRANRPLNAQATHMLAYAKEEAGDLGHNYLGTEHLLLGLLRTDCPARDFLQGMGVTLGKAQAGLVKILGGQARSDTSR